VSDLDDLVPVAHSLALEAGEIMLRDFAIGGRFTLKEDATPVTRADVAINQLVIDRITDRCPGHGVIGEELSIDGDSERTWVCDPIDGTTPHVLGVPTSMFALALVEEGQPVLAVLYDPHLRRLYEATATTPALLNGSPIRVSATDDLRGSYVASLVADLKQMMVDPRGLTSGLLEHGVRCLSFISGSYEASLVAAGQLVAQIYPCDSPWDVAAPKLIVERAGGRVTDLAGDDQCYDRPVRGAVFSNGRLHDQVVDLIEPHLLAAEP
jgi:fructose-1,6-bisphosphatase/inositol monophosphatase family enzyme